MVDSQLDQVSLTGRIILTPNFSWSWGANLKFLYTLMAVSLTMSMGFLVAGAWVILPYAVLELSVLWLCIYYCVYQCNRQEVITILEHEVIVERGVLKRQESRNFNRSWSQFLITRPKRYGDPDIVSIRSHGEEMEIGSFLSKPDKSQLIAHLRRVVSAWHN
ncbi:MAG: putative membrane protein [Cyclobacteriaceae bacterium]|jgi:uncharacterized membrane protein